MISGVNFQPGGQPGDPSQSRPSSVVQEAIKVLSLRLPKVVGAQAAAPQALLSGSGSGGSRVDSVVNQVLSRIMPTGQPAQPPTATMPPRTVGPQSGESHTGRPSFSGGSSPQAPAMPSWPWTGQAPQQEQPWSPPAGFNPRVVIEGPSGQGDFMTGPGGAPIGVPSPFQDGSQPPATIAPSPDFDLIERLLGNLFTGGGGGGTSAPEY